MKRRTAMKRTICNPVAVSYAYQDEYYSRELADPAVILYGDTYFLFASHGCGYWTSTNLADWNYIAVDTEKFPQFRRFAPAVCLVGKTMYIAHSQGGTILKSDTPFNPESWIDIGKAFDWNDPAFWTDDDGFVYIYEGLHNKEPIRASKLDPNNGMKVVEGPVACCFPDMTTRGFERAGDNNQLEYRLPYFEGAWMNKFNGRYYLTYAAPGTEFPVYADGCFVGDSPMGPFTYCENSPVVWKNTGFLRGCGHGCVFEDKQGRIWKMDTVAIGVNHAFERRLTLLPSKLGEDGLLYTNTEHGDYPMYVPEENDDPFGNPGPDWVLLSSGASARASSLLDEAHSPEKCTEEDGRTWWSAKTGNPGEYVEIDLGRTVPASAIQVCFADQDITVCAGRKHGFSYQYVVEASVDGVKYETLEEVCDMEPLDYSYRYFDYETPKKLRFVRLTNRGMIPAAGKMAVSGIRIFGKEDVPAPDDPTGCKAVRCEDDRGMDVSWEPVEGAIGYLIRFGIHENELHTHVRLYGNVCERRINCLNSGVPYYVTVSAFGAGGVSGAEKVMKV